MSANLIWIALPLACSKMKLKKFIRKILNAHIRMSKIAHIVYLSKGRTAQIGAQHGHTTVQHDLTRNSEQHFNMIF